MDPKDADDLASVEEIFSRVADELFLPGSVQETLQRIVDAAERTIDSCDAAGVLAVDEDGGGSTLAASNPRAAALDQAQTTLGEGPCLDAARTGTTSYAPDLLDDTRWPRFGPAAAELDARTVLALSIGAATPSALNLYAGLPMAFSVGERAQGQLLATLARLALDSAEGRAASEVLAGQFQAGLRTREMIGQAQGILMERERITAEQAFDVLRRASQRLNVKLRTVAEDVVRTGELPETETESGGPAAP